MIRWKLYSRIQSSSLHPNRAMFVLQFRPLHRCIHAHPVSMRTQGAPRHNFVNDLFYLCEEFVHR